MTSFIDRALIAVLIVGSLVLAANAVWIIYHIIAFVS